MSCNTVDCRVCTPEDFGAPVYPRVAPPHSTDCREGYCGVEGCLALVPLGSDWCLEHATSGSREDDPVNRPAHYTDGDVEFIDAVRATLGAEGFRAFCRGNAMKYVWRARLKGGDQDLRKAITYLRHAIEDDPR